MYAVIRAGGRQLKVSEGDVIQVDRLRDASGEVEFRPLLIVSDDGSARAGPSELAEASVRAEVVEEIKGPKVDVTKYRPKTGYRRHTGHRQRYTSVRIAEIRLGEKDKGGAARKTRRKAKGTTRDGT